MKEIKIGNVTFPFDASDLDTRERFCDALETYLEKARVIDSTYESSSKTQRDLLVNFKGICEGVYAFLDQCLGEGAAVKALGERYNIDSCVEVFEIMNAAIAEHDQGIATKVHGNK